MADQPHIAHAVAGVGIIARAAVITLSDTRDKNTDKSGGRIIELLTGAGHFVARYEVMRDEPAEFVLVLIDLLKQKEIDLVITNGGTGISRRDQTVDVVERELDQPLPGFGELFRMLSWQEVGAAAMLSRAVAGVSRGKPVFALPGSTPAVELAMTKLILPVIGHLLRELRK